MRVLSSDECREISKQVELRYLEEKRFYLHVSCGNSKIGRTMNCSRLPIVDCIPGIPCGRASIKRNGKKGRPPCYACKFVKRPAVKFAWTHNSLLHKVNPRRFWYELRLFIRQASPEKFRMNVASDLTTAFDWNELEKTARWYPQTQFLIFTKAYELSANVAQLPNLMIIWSAWPGLPIPEKRPESIAATAWLLANEKKFPALRDDRIPSPERRLDCPGDCTKCWICWQIRKVNMDVCFHKH